MPTFTESSFTKYVRNDAEYDGVREKHEHDDFVLGT